MYLSEIMQVKRSASLWRKTNHYHQYLSILEDRQWYSERLILIGQFEWKYMFYSKKVNVMSFLALNRT